MRHQSIFAIIAVCLISIGCGGSSGPTLHPVSGQITIGGQPANNVTVEFQPVGAEGAAASGTALNGKYTMYSGVAGDSGVQAGKYTVQLRDVPALDDAGYMDAGDGGAPAPPKGMVPADYKPIEVEVPAPDGTLDIAI